jgi:hypothetical protein
VHFQGDASKPFAEKNWGWSVQRHVKATLKGRLDTECSLKCVAKGIVASGDNVARRLLDTEPFIAAQKQIVADTQVKLQEH